MNAYWMNELGEGISPEKAALMEMTLFFAINKFAQPDYVFIPLPCRPPNWIIMHGVCCVSTMAIFTMISLIVYKRILVCLICLCLDQNVC